MRDVVCQYCKVKDNKDNMVFVQNNKIKKYYHSRCLELKKSRDEAIEIFYDYTKSLEPIKKLYDVFNKIKNKGMNEEQILYLVKYVRDNNRVLNYPHGLLYYLDAAIKDYKKNKKIYTITKITKSDEDFVKLEIKKDTTTKDDEMDISDFL